MSWDYREEGPIFANGGVDCQVPSVGMVLFVEIGFFCIKTKNPTHWLEKWVFFSTFALNLARGPTNWIPISYDLWMIFKIMACFACEMALVWLDLLYGLSHITLLISLAALWKIRYQMTMLILSFLDSMFFRNTQAMYSKIFDKQLYIYIYSKSFLENWNLFLKKEIIIKLLSDAMHVLNSMWINSYAGSESTYK